MTRPWFHEVNNGLLCLVNTEDQIVDFTPVHQVSHLVPVGQFAVIPDEAHNCCVVRKVQEVIGVESGQQSWVIRVNSRGLRTQPSGEPMFREVALEMLFFTRTDWDLLVKKSSSQLHRGVPRPR